MYPMGMRKCALFAILAKCVNVHKVVMEPRITGDISAVFGDTVSQPRAGLIL